MTVYAKPTVRHAWAETAGSADLVDPGDTYSEAGWLIGVKPPRQYMNWAQNWVSEGIRYFCQQGVSEYDAAETYNLGSVIQGPDNLLYQSLQGSNIGHLPSANPVYWGPVQGAAPANTDSSNSLATTSWVKTNALLAGSPFSVLSGTIANTQVGSGAVTQWQGSLVINFSQLTGQASTGQIPLAAVQQYQGNFAIGWGQITGTKNADQLQGLPLGPNGSYSGNAVPRYDSAGNLYTAYLSQGSPNSENPSISQILVTNGVDNFLRQASVAALLNSLGLTGAGVINGSGPWWVQIGQLIIQFGISNYPALNTTPFYINLPKTFPNAGLWGNANPTIGGYTPGMNSVTTTQLIINMNQLGGTNQNFWWVAIGY